MRNATLTLALLLGLAGCASSVGTDTRFEGTDPAYAGTDILRPGVETAGLASDDVAVANDEEPYYHPERSFAVVMVEEGDVLNVREGAGVGEPIVGELAPESVELTATGREEMVGTQRWVEILLPVEGKGWVNSYYLTELVAPAAFCEDTQITDLLTDLQIAIRERDGEQLFAAVSPKHGLTVQVTANGAKHRFDDAEARDLFDSRERIDWGTDPYTGEELRSTFAETVVPGLETVLADENSVVTCNDLVLGGHAYDVRLSPSLANYNFYTLHFPGTAAYDGMDWSTWIVGVEYSEGVPYVVSLLHYAR